MTDGVILCLLSFSSRSLSAVCQHQATHGLSRVFRLSLYDVLIMSLVPPSCSAAHCLLPKMKMLSTVSVIPDPCSFIGKVVQRPDLALTSFILPSLTAKTWSRQDPCGLLLLCFFSMSLLGIISTGEPTLHGLCHRHCRRSVCENLVLALLVPPPVSQHLRDEPASCITTSWGKEGRL